MEQLSSHWTDFHEIWYMIICPKSVEKIQISLKYYKNNRHFIRRRLYFYDNTSLDFSYNDNFLQKKSCREICGNKMPTGCNRGFYCRSYCLLNMFWAPVCPSSGAQEYYTVVAACGISCCGFQVAGLVWSWGLCVRFTGCWFTSTKCHRQQPLYNTLELLMMGIVVPEGCWASNKICNKNPCCI